MKIKQTLSFSENIRCMGGGRKAFLVQKWTKFISILNDNCSIKQGLFCNFAKT